MFAPSPNLLIDERYRLTREIGRGAMGSVWEALDLQLDGPCARKFIVDQYAENAQLRERFLREAKVCGKLRSPHAVQVRGVGEWQGALYLAMELLLGETLADRLQNSGPLSRADTVTIIQQVAEVLDQAHALGIVHRDLKPANLWLWRSTSPMVKVLDFGVAKQLQPDGLGRTATGAVVGTPRYMSPEQASGSKSVDHRTDIWALAVIAVECLSGRAVFDAAGVGDLFVKIISHQVPRLEQLGLTLPGTMDAWWEQSLAAEPDRRFQTGAQLAAALRDALAGIASQASGRGAGAGNPWTGTVRVAPAEAPLHRPAVTNLSAVSNVVTVNPGQTGSQGRTAGPHTLVWVGALAGVVLLVGGAAWFWVERERSADATIEAVPVASAPAAAPEPADPLAPSAAGHPMTPPKHASEVPVPAPPVAAAPASSHPSAPSAPSQNTTRVAPPPRTRTPSPASPPPQAESPATRDRARERQLGF